MGRRQTQAIMSAIMEAHLAWRRMLQVELVGMGITRQQVYVLRMLAPRAYLNPSMIAEQLSCDRPTLSGVLSIMRRNDWVAYERDPENAKFIRVSITSGGRARLKELDRQRALPGRPRFDPLESLSSKERTTLATLLAKVNSHLASAPWRAVTNADE